MLWNGPLSQGPKVPNVVVQSATYQRSRSMEKITTVGLDLAKTNFQVHAIDDAGTPIVRRALRRSQVLAFFGKLPPCVVAWKPAGVLTSGLGR